jgi:hypothetical protein
LVGIVCGLLNRVPANTTGAAVVIVGITVVFTGAGRADSMPARLVSAASPQSLQVVAASLQFLLLTI